MTYLLIARKGGGKGAVAVELALHHLLDKRETRPVITNVDFRDHKFAAYIHQNKGSVCGRFFHRRGANTRTNVDWQRQFWRDRGDDVLPVKKVVSVVDGYCSYEIKAEPRHGCIYIVDEVGGAFAAREWQQFSGEAGWYMRAERHMEDIVYLMVQDETLIDVTFSKLFNEVWRIHAGWLVTVAGFRQPKKFYVNVFANLEGWTPMQRLRQVTYPFNQEHLELYRTKSLGRASAHGGESAKPHGLPFWIFPASLVTVLVVIGICFRLVLPWIAKSVYSHTMGLKASTEVHKQLTMGSERLLIEPVHPKMGTNAPPWQFFPPSHLTNPPPVRVQSVPAVKDSPKLYGWLSDATDANTYWCNTNWGYIRVPDLVAYHGMLLHLGGGRWRVGEYPEGFKVQLPDGWAS